MDLLPLFSFFAGILTILSPCIWPVLPVVLGVSANGGRKKAFGLSLGISLSFIFLTLLSSFTISKLNINADSLQKGSAIFLILLGTALIFPRINNYLEYFLSRLLSKSNFKFNPTSSTFFGGLLTGLILGVLWTPCAGPILASLIALTATSGFNNLTIFSSILYGVGVSIPLFFVALYGSKVFAKFKILSANLVNIQRLFGAIIIIFGILALTSYDKLLQAKILNSIPGSDFLNKLELKFLDSNAKKKTSVTPDNPELKLSGIQKNTLPNLGDAPELVGITNWLNTEKPLSLADLKGKVVLIDFWTYSCINCIRTFPHITGWYEKYKDKGFVVIGVHTPEFEFEKNTKNIQQALDRYKITYPIAQDDNYKTWNAFNNKYWPAHYLIDAQGKIRLTHFGEGEYAETEKAIQDLLAEAGMLSEKMELNNLADQTPNQVQSPETYFGLARMSHYVGDTPKLGENTFKSSQAILNYFSLAGKWNMQAEYAESISTDAKLEMKFQGKRVFLVITPAKAGDKIKVYINDKLISAEDSGADVKNSEVTLDTDRLYEIVSVAKYPFITRVLRVEFLNSGTKVYSATFGN